MNNNVIVGSIDFTPFINLIDTHKTFLKESLRDDPIANNEVNNYVLRLSSQYILEALVKSFHCTDNETELLTSKLMKILDIDSVTMSGIYDSIDAFLDKETVQFIYPMQINKIMIRPNNKIIIIGR